MKFNLYLLKKKGNLTKIVRWINGEIDEREVVSLLEAITEQPKESTPEPPPTPAQPTKLEEFEAAIKSRRKDDLVAFAQKYNIDLTEATNNNLRVKLIKEHMALTPVR